MENTNAALQKLLLLCMMTVYSSQEEEHRRVFNIHSFREARRVKEKPAQSKVHTQTKAH